MPIRLHNLRADIDRAEEALPGLAAAKLQLDVSRIADIRLVRRAVDARKHRPPVFVYTVDVTLGPDEDESGIAADIAATLVADAAAPELTLQGGDAPLPGRPVVVGAGPAGLFAGLLLAEAGFRPLIIERGQPVPQRADDVAALFQLGQLDPESNILFGLGGAGTWSDGKLTWHTNNPLAEWVLDALVGCGAPEHILVDAHPHIGTDKLRAVTTNLARRIEAGGGEFRFGTRVTGLLLQDGRAAGVKCGDETIEAGAVILGIGHSARDTFHTLADQGVAIEPRPFQIGVRIEHPQQLVDKSQYGTHAGHAALPPSEYALQHKAHGGWRSVHSFCMCPGGTVVPSMSRDGEVCTNGMSDFARDGAFANAALVVPVGPQDFGTGRFAGLAFQERIERAAFKATGSLCAPAQRADDFVADRKGSAPGQTSYPLGVVPVQFSQILPRPVYQSIVRALGMRFGRSIAGFAGECGTVLGPETRVTSPVRIVRDKTTRESVERPGLYPIGEGSGYAGGIISSALDGLATAKTIIEGYSPRD
jgi:uncharacterized protein